jgi:Ca2+:H+ antiporter
VASLVLCGLFVFVQTIRYRDYFLPPPCPPSPPDAAPGGTDLEAPNIDLAHGAAGAPRPPAPQHPADTPDTGTAATATADTAEHAPPPSAGTAVASLGLLVAALIGVVGLAKVESPSIGEAVAAAGLPGSFVGVVIAL